MPSLVSMMQMNRLEEIECEAFCKFMNDNVPLTSVSTDDKRVSTSTASLPRTSQLEWVELTLYYYYATHITYHTESNKTYVQSCLFVNRYRGLALGMALASSFDTADTEKSLKGGDVRAVVIAIAARYGS